ncbi:hypothetical protein ABEB36_004518 [Hypothenemus hampei]|uniref:C-type lectin domain-containing protein n=1 Tax=Hypothenemus hampei TaxID=57062 RepID=A0ABD1F3L7_HYPHA
MAPLIFLVLTALFLVAESTPHGNVTGVIQLKKYYVITDYRTFVSAMLMCKILGMKMATVKNIDEQLLLKEAIDTYDLTESGYWIGAGTEIGNEDDFHWVETGVKLTYTNWGSLQPNFDFHDKYAGNCVRVGNYDKVNEPYKWQSVDCNIETYYICEIE